ncbi:MAG: nitroreductase family protein [Methanothrix sp.]|jgi:nitroreductase|uniref:Nitroreductase n=1 Tax=Methanothrix thermoacetophila (strain DSM 6194 / JCM 14653 / NBRC 101360 / PT) TaxID=349307 RepID=A0B948_METTP|nr:MULTISPECIES: nitroreductase family protein [Methanothrix]ABK15222.1 nitroreductase [Methanothrix thermoacetophila PT]MBC7079194.1 nitroreductase family protein [Methanothrix sp.]NPU86658.1 nitroreductase [Methanothrix sp.]
MDVIEAIRKRRSIRKYQERPVEEEKLNRILEAGRLAPSAKNLQDWKFVVVRDKERRKRLAEAAKNQWFIAEAPVVIVACGTETKYVMTCGQHTYTIDVSIAVDHMTLEATELGLGTCWIGAFYEDRVKKILDVPENIRVVALLPLGYPAEDPEPRPRKPVEEIVCYERWC